MLIEVDEKEFKEKVKIRFSNINDGFFRFSSNTLICDEDNDIENNTIKCIEECFNLNGVENSYIDFYYNEIDDKSKKRLEKLLCDEDRDFLYKFKSKCSDSGIYYRLSKESIPFIVRLNLNEVLFSTIYFTKYPITIWGNYNKKFPVFYIEDGVLKKYKFIAKNNKLIIK